MVMDTIPYAMPDCGTRDGEAATTCLMSDGILRHRFQMNRGKSESLDKNIANHIQRLQIDWVIRMNDALEYNKAHGGTQYVTAERNLRQMLGVERLPLNQIATILANHQAMVSKDIRSLQIAANNFSRTGGNSLETIQQSDNAMNQLGTAQEILEKLRLTSDAVNKIINLKKASQGASGYGRKAYVHPHGNNFLTPPQATFYRIHPSM